MPEFEIKLLITAESSEEALAVVDLTANLGQAEITWIRNATEGQTWQRVINPGNRVEWHYMVSDPENGPDCDELITLGGIVQSIWENGDLNILADDEETHRVKRNWLV